MTISEEGLKSIREELERVGLKIPSTNISELEERVVNEMTEVFNGKMIRLLDDVINLFDGTTGVPRHKLTLMCSAILSGFIRDFGLSMPTPLQPSFAAALRASATLILADAKAHEEKDAG